MLSNLATRNFNEDYVPLMYDEDQMRAAGPA
jgi:hypothetical protein